MALLDESIAAPPQEPLRLITLSVSNVLGIELAEVQFDPDGGLVTIAGNNSAGKTSLLNAIWLALANPTASRKISKPVKVGENYAYVQLELGDSTVALTVTREWDLNKRQPNKLVVTRADGIPISRPQDLLDELIGAYSFDPYAFAEANDSARSAMYLEALGVDVSALEEEENRFYTLRTAAKASRDALEARLRAAIDPGDVPDHETPNTELTAQLRAAMETNAANERMRTQLANAERAVTDADARVAAAEEAVRRAQEALASEKERRDDAVVLAKDLATEIKNLEDVNVDDIEAAIAANEETNAKVRAAADYRALHKEHHDAVGHVGDLELQVAEVRAKIRAVIAGAKSPIDGLHYERGVVYYGPDQLPFNQACDSDKLRVSLAFAMALNPAIRLIRCEGSRIDAEGLRIIDDMTREHGYQVLMEKVGMIPGASVVMEAGRTVSATIAGD